MREAWGVEHRVGHRWNPVANPVAPETLDRAVDLLDLGVGCRALDVGCGKGYLVDLLARTGADVVGYDQSLDALDGARARLRRSGTRAVLLHCRRPPPGRWDVVSVLGSADALTTGRVADALAPAAALLAPGGRLIFADGYWSANPAPALLDRLAEEARRMTDLPTLLRAAADAGLVVVAEFHSSKAVWDDHMRSYCAALASAPANGEDPLVLRLTGRLLWRDYLEWQREHLGFVTLVCRAP